MNRVEDRTIESFKAQEREFYSEQWAYNTRIKEQQDIIDSPTCTEDEKLAAKREKAILEEEKYESIDCWKEEHGPYNEDMTKWTVDEAVDRYKEEAGLDMMQAGYDKNQYGHVEEHEQEEEQDEELGY